ncbi:MAG: response regulator [Nitrospirae bacterium]|nr:response regulator [Nitrospirota bacterium]
MDKQTEILIVDDQYEVREVIRFILKDKYSIATVGGVEEAFRYLEVTSVKLVLLDIKMPKIDGITALEHIKKKYPGTEVIMVTAYATLETVRKAVRLGAFGFLMKPFDIDVLIKTVDGALNNIENKR